MEIHQDECEITAGSRYEIFNVEENLDDHAEIFVEVFDATSRDTSKTLACRVIVTASDGSHPDGGDQGVYADGRFFCEGRFTVNVPPGTTELLIQKGFSYVPLTAQVTATVGQRLRIRVWLFRWFAPEDKGWYGGDNHVHSQHDVTAIQKTGLHYTALQGRANGLSYITESGSHVSYNNMDQLSTDDFLLQYAEELGPACYTGHLITPGLTTPFSREQLSRMGRTPLFTRSVVDAANRQGAAVIYTHPLTPIHQMHWMGATEALSDAVLGKCAHLFDLDSKATELLWFSLLNLGNKLGCSSYTDSALERFHTLSPGDRRVYAHSTVLDYPAIVDALRQGRTFATNGPVFSFFHIDHCEPGDILRANPQGKYVASMEIHTLYPLKEAALYRQGKVVTSFDVAGQSGTVTLTHEFEESDTSWYVFRAMDERGHWCVTSPIYFEGAPSEHRSGASAIVFEISNHSRFSLLEQDYFAHAVVTTSPHDGIAEVALLRDNATLATFVPQDGDHTPTGRTPVTESEQGVPYELGWMWFATEGQKNHFQLDYPVSDSGQYAVRMTSVSGETIISDAIRFDKTIPRSQALSLAHLKGNETDFVLWGYGEEKWTDPSNREDGWWYPNNSVWRVAAKFDGLECELLGGVASEEEVRRQLLLLFLSGQSMNRND